MSGFVQGELSYKIVGLLFDIHTELGNRYQEKYYQRAIEQLLKENNMEYKRELMVDLIFRGKKIGKYFMDFLIEEKIVLEIKTVPRLLPKDFKQVLEYMIVHNLELGILANFRTDRLIYKRILNSKYNPEIKYSE